ncbi:hypothetical protein [Variovorax ginsengisoli]|uniref:Uncharacterized protein n=1 Tax=Variovorax ginsengisoli TaxID=363844 RepID=A0ABT9SFS2_9BURK|nr:hypothetical protein [Variovorax ginsengisoli]MDP9902643.1 hypothetical protein [Variovorax ginsengisoli]
MTNFEGSLVVTLECLPAPYPLHLFSTQQGDTAIQLGLNANGNFFAVIVSPSEVHRARFQRIQIAGPARLIVIVTWSKDGITAAIEGVELENSSGPLRVFESSERIRNKPELERAAHEIECTELEWLFIETLFDLEEKLNVASSYSLRRAAGLIRQLIVDGANLVDAVNREYRLPIRFEVPPDHKERGKHDLDLMPTMHVWRLREGFEDPPRILVNLSSLRKQVVAHHGGTPINLDDFIDFAANSRGGVHWDESTLPPSRNRINALSWVGRLNSAEITIQDLGYVLIEGLIPLLNAINRRRAIRGLYTPAWKSYCWSMPID